MPTTSTYVYCIVAAPRRPALAGVPSGVSGSRAPRLLDAGPGRWIVVADVPARRYSEEAIARGLSDLDWVSRAAVAHERVVEFFLNAPAVVPMKLFTIFMNDERALAHVRGLARQVDGAIRRVKGHHEWSVRVARSSATDGAAKKPRPAARSGAGYLAMKKALRDESAVRLREVQHRVAEGYDELAATAARARRRPASEMPAGGALLLDGAFLVPRGRESRFRTTAARLARELGAACEVTLTGPWPPYSFVQD